MSARQREEFIPFLLARDGYVCNTKRGHGCGKTISELIAESSVREELQGKPRKTVLLTVDHIDNNSTHNHDFDDEGNITGYCTNLQLLCWSCNLRKRKLTKSTTTGRELTEAQKHKQKNEPRFINMILDELEKREHVCIKGIIAKGARDFGSQVTLWRYLETEIFDEIENHEGRFQTFDNTCSFKTCNGEHICRTGNIPIIETDADRKAKEELEREAYIAGGHFFAKTQS